MQFGKDDVTGLNNLLNFFKKAKCDVQGDEVMLLAASLKIVTGLAQKMSESLKAAEAAQFPKPDIVASIDDKSTIDIKSSKPKGKKR